jgi:hypothetical protein
VSKLTRSFDSFSDSSNVYDQKINWPSDYLYCPDDAENNILYENGVLTYDYFKNIIYIKVEEL